MILARVNTATVYFIRKCCALNSVYPFQFTSLLQNVTTQAISICDDRDVYVREEILLGGENHLIPDRRIFKTHFMHHSGPMCAITEKKMKSI